MMLAMLLGAFIFAMGVLFGYGIAVAAFRSILDSAEYTDN